MFSFVSGFFNPDPLSREWEAGRREGFKPFIKQSDHYIKVGVSTTEVYGLNSRNVEIHSKEWRPLIGKIKGLVFYCHGYGDCCDYLFDDVAISLAQAGFAVFAMDYEGHGRSQGLHVYIPSFNVIVNDVIEFCDKVKGKDEFKGLPSFLYGESMGGAVALKIHLRQPGWTGIVLVAPMCKIADDMVPPAPVTFLLKRLAFVLPKLQIVPTGDILEIGFRVPEKREIARKNPVSTKHPPRLATALQLLSVTQELGQEMEKVSVPLLILHGAQDKVTNPEVSKELHERSSGPSTLKLYPDSFHGLTSGEPDEVVKEILGDIVAWLDSMCEV